MANPNPSPATRFQPGNNANANGRPRGPSLTTTLRERIEEFLKGGDKTIRAALVDKLLRVALKGRRDRDAILALKEIFLRLDGPPARPEADGNAFLSALELAESVDADFVPDAPPGPATPQE